MLGTASPVGAQDAAASRDEEARALFQAGLTAYESRRYEDALRHFRSAYEASRRPELLYNIGLAADRMRRDEEALEAFREYLRRVPDAERRAEVEERIDVLERSLETRRRARRRDVRRSSDDGTPHAPARDGAAGAAPSLAVIVSGGEHAAAVGEGEDGEGDEA